jgi:regulator of sigma E protease
MAVNLDWLNWLWAALGLGFVIFVHELGHFMVAKWCGVRVERFSIGFGPVIWSVIRGETEYALSIVPFGGYVKMLGQDDVDPSQMTNEDIARDPRSYTAKSVPQRMAIISAGVIMNIITGTLMFAGCYMLGMREPSPVIGNVSPGSPAWAAGLQGGDTIDEINGHKASSFMDILRTVMLRTEPVDLVGTHADGSKFEMHIVPEVKSNGENKSRIIGVTPSDSLELYTPRDKSKAPVTPDTAAARAEPPFEGGDRITSVDGKPVKNYAEFASILSKRRAKTLEIGVTRASKPGAEAPTATVKLPPSPMRLLGLQMDIGQIAKIRKGSPADGKLQAGDKITHVIDEHGKSREVGRDLDPLELPDYLASLHGQTIELQVQREVPGSHSKTERVPLVPEDAPGWTEPPTTPDSPVTAPAIGVAYYVLHDVLVVRKGSPAEGKIKPKDQIQKVTFLPPKDAKSRGKQKPIDVAFGPENRNWPYAFWIMQRFPDREVTITVASEGKEQTVELTPELSKDRFLPTRGLELAQLRKTVQESNPLTALDRGIQKTRDFMGEIYLVLYSLITGHLSPTQLQGPFGIVQAAAVSSDEGFSALLYFLGYLSINLAILNFLPIPLLDGGHMLFLLYEGVRGKPASERVQVAALYTGMLFILSLMMFVIYLDIGRWWKG